MRCVEAGGDRQELHERIREHSMAAAANVKNGGENDLMERIKSDSAFVRFGDVLGEIADPNRYTGRAAGQTEAFVGKVRREILCEK